MREGAESYRGWRGILIGSVEVQGTAGEKGESLAGSRTELELKTVPRLSGHVASYDRVEVILGRRNPNSIIVDGKDVIDRADRRKDHTQGGGIRTGVGVVVARGSCGAHSTRASATGTRAGNRARGYYARMQGARWSDNRYHDDSNRDYPDALFERKRHRPA